jgi:hypothetical protein
MRFEDFDPPSRLSSVIVCKGLELADPLQRIGLDWIGLDWIGLDWIGLDWIGLDCAAGFFMALLRPVDLTVG